MRAWQKRTIQNAKRAQAARTLMGRFRPLPDIVSNSRRIRAHCERAAINTPIQGGAADVVMMAMLSLHANKRFKELGWRMLLQIHDEVICEGPRQHVEVSSCFPAATTNTPLTRHLLPQEALQVLINCMSHPFARPLLVDLVVDARSADTWYDAK